MSPTSVIALARDAGIRIHVDDGNLVLEAPAEPPTDVLDLLRRHKTGLIALLTGGAPRWTPEDWQAFFDERAGSWSSMAARRAMRPKRKPTAAA